MARLIDKVIGHQAILSRMIQMFEADQAAQTYLFVGPAGVGKRLSALALAQALICERSLQACGECGSCQRVESGKSENLLLIEPEGTQIKVDQAKQVNEFLNLASWRGRRVIVIDQAQAMNVQAANSLLKTLEEPPVGTYFFLISTSTAGVLPTIRSRSSVVPFRSLTAQEISQKRVGADWMIRASRGSFERLEQLNDPDEQEVRSVAAHMLDQFIKNPDYLTSHPWRDEVKERARAHRILHYWISFIRDAVCLQVGEKNAVLNTDQGPLLQAMTKLRREKLFFLLEKLFQLEFDMHINRDWQLAFEELWVRGKYAAMD